MTTALPQPLPKGVIARSLRNGVRVRLTGEPIGFGDIRIWAAVAAKIAFVLIFVAILALAKGVSPSQAHFVPMVVYLAVIMGLFTFIRTRRRLSNREASTTMILFGESLTIMESRIAFTRGGRALDLLPSESNYQLTDVEYFGFGDVSDPPLHQRVLQVHLINGSTHYHLRDHESDQIRWACLWLSTALREALD